MESNLIKEELYKYSKSFAFIDSCEYISNKIDIIKMNNEYEILDNVFYSMDFSKLNAEIASQLIEATRYMNDKLSMRKFFIESCKKIYIYKKNLFK